MEISHSEVHEILRIIDETESLDEVEIVLGSLRIHVCRSARDGGSRGRVAASAKSEAVRNEAPARVREAAEHLPSPKSVKPLPVEARETPEGVHAIKAPMLGTFYRAPSPGELPFVEVGQRVKADDTVAVIEVMKLFNSIRAGIDGVVTEIVASDASLVEFGQVMLFVRAD